MDAVARTIYSGPKPPPASGPAQTYLAHEGVRAARICITSPYPMGMLSGIGRFVIDLRQTLLSRGMEVDVMSPASTTESSTDSFHSIPLRCAILRNVALALRTGFLWLHRSSQFDVLHAQQAHLQSIATLLVARITGAPGLLTLHLRVARPAGRFRRLLLALTEWFAIHAASKVIAVSQSVAESFEEREVLIIENGVNTNRFAPALDREAVRKSLGLGRSPTFLFAGRWSRTKGLDLLLRAATGTALRDLDFRLLILGEPARDEPGLIEETVPKPSRDRLRVVGRVSEEELPSYLCAADVFVLPSRIEGMPIAALEALACGVPLLVSDIPALKRLIVGTGAGWTFRSEDVGDLERAIVEILSTGRGPDQRVRAREEAVHRYSLDTMATRYLELYQEDQRNR